MKHIKLFEEYRLEEVFSKKWQHSGYDESRVSEPLKKFWAGILGLITESPVAFEFEQGQEYIQIGGPFGIRMRFGFDEKKKVFYVRSEKFDLENESAEKVFKEAKKSMEFKYLLKGTKVEKLKADRVKKILKSLSGADLSTDSSKVIDYLYYSDPKKIVDKADNSGPWATSGTSVDTYSYDLEPLADLISGEDLNKVIMDNKDEIIKKLGHYANGIMSKKILKYEITESYAGDSLIIQVETHIYYN